MNGGRDRHLTLAVPGLLGPLGAMGSGTLETARALCEGLSLPSLERFFSRARRIPLPAPDGLTALLFDCFGVARVAPDWPVAAVTRRVDGGGEDGRWSLRADPVHLRAGMGDLNLLDSAELPIASAEAGALAAEINAQMDDPAFRLEALAPRRWYLGLDEAPKLLTRAPWEVGGAPIRAHLPQGEDARHWRTRINDVQMILHASAVNRAREARGEPAINSLWLWGGGVTPRVPTGTWQGVCCDDALVAGLAALARAPVAALPGDAAAWLALAATPGNHLLVWTAAYQPARRSDVDAWRNLVSRFEECWMAPLLAALAGGAVESMRLRCAQGFDYSLRRGELGRWWRRRKSFARIMCDSGLSRPQHE